MKKIFVNVEETLNFANFLGEYIEFCYDNSKNYPKVLYFDGELGAGKTTFISALVRAFKGSEEAEISSPSFTICNEYPTIPEIYHADLYRLPDNCSLPYELLDLPKENILIIEWAKRLRPDQIEKDSIFISMECFLEKEIEPDLNIEKNIEKNRAEKLDKFENSCEKKRRINLFTSSDIMKEFLDNFKLFILNK